MINKFVSGGGSGKAKVDEVTGSIKLGKDAGTTLNSDDNDNIAIGTNALNSVTTNCDNNIAIGTNAGTAITTGENNMIMGTNAGMSLTDSDNNIAIGLQALTSASTGEADNIAIGKWSMIMQNNSACDFNVAIGTTTLVGNTNANNNNVAIGYNAISNTTGTYIHNVGIGPNTLVSAGDKYGNIAIGSSAGYNMTTGDENVIIGNSNANGPTTGNSNVIIGSNADRGITDWTVSDHIVIGGGGGFKSLSKYIVLNDFTSVSDNDAATAPLMKFPQYGFIKRITVVCAIASGGTGIYNVSLGTAVEAPGDTVADRLELIGATQHASTKVGSTLRASTLSADADTMVDIGGTLKQVFIWESGHITDDSSGWALLEAADVYLYVCHASGSNADHATDTKIVLTAEWMGED